MKTVAAPIDTRVRDAYVKILLRIEEENGEKIINYARIALTALYFALGVLLGKEVAMSSRLTIFAGASASLIFSALTHYLIHYGRLTHKVKIFASVFDVAIVSIALHQFGEYRTFKSEAYLLYFVWIALVNLRFTPVLTILASTAAIFFYALLALIAVQTGTIQTGSLYDSYTSGSVSLTSVALKLLFLSIFAVAAVQAARGNRRLINKSVETELEAARQHEDRMKAQFASLAQTKQMLDSFSRFVPARFLEFLHVKDMVDIELGACVEKEITLLFVDIRNFTGMSEKMSVFDNFRFLNAYLKRMGPIIEQQGGIIDKFVGDEIMCLFPDSPQKALVSSIEMRRELAIYNTDRKKMNYDALDIGAGLHTGNVMLGTVGSENRISTTVIGDNVNLASRLQTLTKIFGVPIILSDAVYRRLDDPSAFCLREIDSVLVRGKEKPIVLYECFDMDQDELRDQKKELHGDLQLALFHYKAGNFAESKQLFVDYEKKCVRDSIPRIYLKRLEKLMQRPTSAKWSGVSRMK